MKLGECYLDGSKDSCLSMGQTVSSHMIKAGAMRARVEIHSIDPEPWPTERPEGWGPGWWFEANVLQHGGTVKRRMILLSLAPRDDGKFYYRGFDPVLACEIWVLETEITAYGPRAEVPGWQK